MLTLRKTFKQINREPLFKIEDVRSIFNKLDATTEESVTKEFLDLNVYLSQDAMQVGSAITFAEENFYFPIVYIIFENVNDRPAFHEHYARLCYRQVEDELITNKGKSKFQRHLNFCAGRLSDPTYYMNLTCNRALFVGHLYLQDLVDFKLMITLIEYLTKSAAFITAECKGYADDDSLQTAVRLLELVGRALHAETQPAYDEWSAAAAAAAAKTAALPAGKTARLPSPSRKNSVPAPFSVDTILRTLEAATPFVNSTTSAMIAQLREVSNNGWVPVDLIDWSCDGPSHLASKAMQQSPTPAPRTFKVTVSNKEAIKPPTCNFVESLGDVEAIDDAPSDDAKYWKQKFDESEKKYLEMKKKYRQLLIMTGQGKHVGK